MTITHPKSPGNASPVESQVVRAWYGQLALAAQTPGLAQHLVFRTAELLPRFSAYYRRLATLPRRIRRALARRRGPSLAGLALLLALGTGSIRAATIVVDQTTCRLSDAIESANTDSVVAFCTAGSGEDLIILNADVLLPTTLLAITSDMTIQAGLGSVVDGDAMFGCFDIASGNVTLDGLTIRNCVRASGAGVQNRNAGTLEVRNCTITGNVAVGSGGGLSNNGTVTIVDSVISGNRVDAYCSEGGGVSNNAYLTIVRSTITNNTAGSDFCAVGGGLSNDHFTNDAVATLTDTTISGNTAGRGGGIHSYYGRMVLTNCTVSGNTATNGAGIMNGGYCEFCHGVPVILDVRNSTISGNSATGVGGGVATYQRGAAVLENSTVSGNTAGGNGGGIVTDNPYENAYITLVNTTVTGNSSGTDGGGMFAQETAVTLSHALVSGNTAPIAAEIHASAAANDDNVLGTDGDAGVVGFTPGPSDIVPAAGVMLADILAPLADNGGPTETHALVSGSPAVDAIPTSDGNCVGTTDQRGFPRPAGAGCDTGSFELGSSPPETLGGSVTGLATTKVTCQNRTNGTTVADRTDETSWDCEALGLGVSQGDRVETTAKGKVTAVGAVSASVTRMTPSKVFCQNVTTRQFVVARSNASSWDCGEMGLVTTEGDFVVTGALGTVD